MAIIKKAKELVDSAVSILVRMQRGEMRPLQTRFDWLNEIMLGGIMPGYIMIIGGISGSGKTYFLQQLEKDIHDPALNKGHKDVILLKCNWEMSVRRLLLRQLKMAIKKTYKELMFQPPSGDDVHKFKDVCDRERNDNIYYYEEPVGPEEWYNDTREFLSSIPKGKRVIVTVDHIALVRDVLGSKKKSMDEFVERMNMLKNEFSEIVSFILLSQLNRDIEGRSELMNMAPRRSDFYNTDTLFHIADFVIVKHNPYGMGHDEYMYINGVPDGVPDNSTHGHLYKYMVRPENKKTSLYTKGLMFFHFLKIRDKEDDFVDIHAIETMPDIYQEPCTEQEDNGYPKVDDGRITQRGYEDLFR